MKPLLAALPALFIATAAFAETCPVWQGGDLAVTGAWSRATIGVARPAIFYAEIRNHGAQADALIDIATPVSERPMLHESVVNADGVATMPHAARIDIPAGGAVTLAPGGYHGMLMGLTTALAQGDSFPLTLTFETAGEITVDVTVGALTARGPECDIAAN